MSDRIPQAMRRMIPDRLLREPRPVVLDRPAEDDLKRLPGDVRNALVAAVHALEDGKANVEAKTRALAGAFTVRLTAAWRAVLYIGQDMFWHLFAVTDHDYSEVQRRFAYVKQVRNMEPGETVPAQRSFSGEDEAIQEIVPGTKYVLVETDQEPPNRYAWTPTTRLGVAR